MTASRTIRITRLAAVALLAGAWLLASCTSTRVVRAPSAPRTFAHVSTPRYGGSLS